MRTVNKAILIGNVTRDPLVKETENKKKIEAFKNQGGSIRTYTASKLP